MSPPLNVNQTLFVILCKGFGGLQVYNIAITITYEVIFIQISIRHVNISSQVVDKRSYNFGQ